jgi:type III secretion protein Q
MTALNVRRVNALTHARAQVVQRWQRAGHCAGLGRPDAPHGYLRFSARGEQGDWRGLVLARDWLHRSLPQLQPLLAVECPQASIAGLFQAVSRPLVLAVDELHYRELADVELIDSAVIQAQELPWIDTSQGRLWLTDLPPQRSSLQTSDWRSWLADLPQRLQLILGVSYLSRSSCKRLGRGDVLLINDPTRQCLLADRNVGVFTFTEEGLRMELAPADSPAQAEAEQPVSADLNHLPIRLEFVLATHDIALGELAAFVAGQLIPLATDAAHRIEVRANGKAVARGELVQLEEHLGVELLEVYRNTISEHRR